MPNIVIYGGPMGSSLRAHWMLAELGLAYETRKLDMANGEHKKPEYLAINPLGQIPSMVYDGFVLTESAAIVQYLAEKHAGHAFFGPMSAESHAELWRWQLFTLLNIDKNLTTFAMKAWGRPADEASLAKASEALDRFLPVFEARLTGRAYLLGDDFTTADLVCRCSFRYAEIGEFDLSKYPAIMAWMKRCADRPAFQKATQG